jgi:hypothetical protein
LGSGARLNAFSVFSGSRVGEASSGVADFGDCNTQELILRKLAKNFRAIGAQKLPGAS